MSIEKAESLELERLVEIAEEAGRASLKFFKKQNLEITQKSDHSPVTEADREAHRIIVQGLSKYAPDTPLISEEGALAPISERLHWSHFFLVDPIDGTKDFIRGSPEFTVNIGFVERSRSILGVVCAPALKVTYFASLEGGAWKKNLDQSFSEAIRIYSETPEDPRKVGYRCLESRSHAQTWPEKLSLAVAVRERLCVGSSLKFCYLAEGKADLYVRLGRMNEWDVAAGDAIYRYSGRKDENHSPLTYNNPDLKVCPFILGPHRPNRWEDLLVR